MLVPITKAGFYAGVLSMEHDVLEGFSFWNELREDDRRRLRAGLILRSYRKDEHILFKTVKKDGILFMLGGALRVYLASDTGRELTLFILRQGDAFSIMTVDNATEADVIPDLQAVDDSALAYLPLSVMKEIAYTEPPMARFVFETCSRSAQAILNNISFFVFNGIRSCIAREILKKSEAAGQTETISITHEELANSLGTTRVVVSREIDALRDRGLIRTGRGRIELLDRAGLRAAAGQKL